MRRRVLAPPIRLADQALEEAGEAPLPERLTLHSLRRTFASLLVAVGTDPAAVMVEMGHTDPGMTLRVYAQAMQLDEAECDRLRALVGVAVRSRAVESAQTSSFDTRAH